MYIIKSLAIAASLLISSSLIGLDKVFTTVILIDGNPELVELNSEGDILKRYKTVPLYFSSNKNHNDFVIISLEDYKAEMALLASIKMIKYDPLSLRIDELAVDKIRAIAAYYDENPGTGILLTAHNTDEKSSDHNDHVFRLVGLLEDFGVEKNHIQISQKKHIGSEVYPFVKVEIQKK